MMGQWIVRIILNDLSTLNNLFNRFKSDLPPAKLLGMCE